MSIGCLMITTNHPDRFEMTLQAMDSVNKCSHDLDQKILSIDLLPEMSSTQSEYEMSLISAAERWGWQVVIGECTGQRAMVNNICRGLKLVHTDRLFYCEDHVIIQRIPSEEDLDYASRHFGIGWVCYNTHVHQENLLNVSGFVERPGREARLAFVNDLANWSRTFRGEEFFRKDAPIQDEYYLNFPAVITYTELFTKLLLHGIKEYHGIGIEQGFTKAWFDTKFNRTNCCAIYVQPRTIEALPLASFAALHQRACMRFRNNDPSMLHSSIIPHSVLPTDVKMQRSFF